MIHATKDKQSIVRQGVGPPTVELLKGERVLPFLSHKREEAEEKRER